MTHPDPSRASLLSATLGAPRTRALLRYWPTAIDFSEPNPPASILIYLPAILIGRLFGFAPELAVTLLIFAGVFLCLWLSSRILSGSELFRPQDWPNLAALCCVLLLILPGDAFAQREHIALLALMPMLCVYVLRARGSPVESTIAVLVGVGGGIAIAIKPYFAFALILPLAYVGWCRRRRGRVMLPIVLAVYAPSRAGIFVVLGGTSLALIAMSTFLSRAVGATEFGDPVIRIFTLAVFGFALAMLAQAKGWQYHSYPAMALSMFVLGSILVRDRTTFPMHMPKDIAFASALYAGLYVIESFWFLPDPSRVRLVREVSHLVPAHPKVVSINGGAEIAFPLTRKLQGTPLWPVPFQWVSAGAERLLQSATLDPAIRDRIARYARADRQDLVQSIQTGRPDVILIGEGADERWALGHPEVAAALRAYRQVESVDGVEIWLPRTEPSAP